MGRLPPPCCLMRCTVRDPMRLSGLLSQGGAKILNAACSCCISGRFLLSNRKAMYSLFLSLAASMPLLGLSSELSSFPEPPLDLCYSLPALLNSAIYSDHRQRGRCPPIQWCVPYTINRCLLRLGKVKIHLLHGQYI